MPEEKNKKDLVSILKKYAVYIIAGLLTSLGGYLGTVAITKYKNITTDLQFVHDSLRPSIGLIYSYTKQTAERMDSLEIKENSDDITHLSPIEIKPDSITNYPTKLKSEINKRMIQIINQH